MACGDKYKDLLTVRGYTPDEPCGSNLGLGEWACSAIDAQAYNARADEIMSLNTQAWNALVEAGGHPSAEPALMEQVNAYWSAHESMERWSILGPAGQGLDQPLLLYNARVVESALAIMRQGVCVLELLNDRYEAIKGEGSGVQPGPVPPPPESPGGKALGDFTEIVKWGLGGALLLGAGALVVRLVK